MTRSQEQQIVSFDGFLMSITDPAIESSPTPSPALGVGTPLVYAVVVMLIGAIVAVLLFMRKRTSRIQSSMPSSPTQVNTFRIAFS